MKTTKKAVVHKMQMPIADAISDWRTMESLLFPVEDRDIASYRYESQDGSEFIEITPSVNGWATAQDKDVLTYIASILAGQGVEIGSQFVSLMLYDLPPDQLEAALFRLKGIVLNSKFMDGDETKYQGFSLMSAVQIIDEKKTPVEIKGKLSDWCFEVIMRNLKAGVSKK